MFAAHALHVPAFHTGVNVTLLVGVGVGREVGRGVGLWVASVGKGVG